MGKSPDNRQLAAMGNVSLDDFLRESSAFDAVVASTPLPDPFCTASAWLLSAREAFFPDADSAVYRVPHGWAPLIRLRTVFGQTIAPMEASWGLASPTVGMPRGKVARELAGLLLRDRAGWEALYLSGLRRAAPEFRTLVQAFSRGYRLGLGQPTVRCAASLDGGWDGFLSRRTAKFRKNLRRVERRAVDRFRIVFEAPTTEAEALAAYERVLAVERRSWKGIAGHGITDSSMEAFYRAMAPRLAARSGLRITFAQDESGDVGFVLGGVFDGAYRGLQISFDAAYSELSVGNLMQAATIRHLCEAGVSTYDLGTDIEYKRFWAEQRIETVPLVVRP